MLTLWFVVGLALLLLGANLFVHGASSLAKWLGWSPLLVGMTVVAFGSSMPELMVNISAAGSGHTDLAFGNIVGSNIINIALILGLAAFIEPLRVQRSIISREIPMMLVSAAAMFVMYCRTTLDGTPNVIDRSDGIILLLLFAIFVFYTAKTAMRKRESDPFLAEVSEEAVEYTEDLPAYFSLPLLVVGLYLLNKGGDWTVAYAKALPMTETVVGLTVVAFITSLPELIQTTVAAIRGHTEIAVGGLVGSNIFNALLIGGVTATIRPMPLPAGGHIDLLMMAFMSLTLLPLAFSGGVISRKEGAFLMASGLAYFGWRIFM